MTLLLPTRLTFTIFTEASIHPYIRSVKTPTLVSAAVGERTECPHPDPAPEVKMLP
jgi:hypothetical protein